MVNTEQPKITWSKETDQWVITEFKPLFDNSLSVNVTHKELDIEYDFRDLGFSHGQLENVSDRALNVLLNLLSLSAEGNNWSVSISSLLNNINYILPDKNDWDLEDPENDPDLIEEMYCFMENAIIYTKARKNEKY